MSGSRELLLQKMQSVAEANSAAVAVREPGKETTYHDLGNMVFGFRELLAERDPLGVSPIGFLLERSSDAYAAMWAAIGEGRAFVPLNLGYPNGRLETIIDSAGIEYVICHPSTVERATGLGFESHQILVLSDKGEIGGADARPWSARPIIEGAAYILYTSGSTGKPKGVPISYDNLVAFIDNMMATVTYPDESICSQVCELSFDVSIQEIFPALLSGATLCPARQIDLFNPAQFVSKNAISVWISVPTLARVALSLPTFDPSALQSIRISIFNGEPLSTQIARDWQSATPQSELWNTYGPTECTVAVTAQLWTGAKDLSEIDVVSIGRPIPGCSVAILDGDEIVPLEGSTPECSGELLLCTDQCFAGYTDPKIAKPFVYDAQSTRYYKTGDKVLWRDNRIFHLGRLDHQVKIGGHRVELMEVEWHLRRALETDALAVVAHPKQQPNELVLFIEGTQTQQDVKTADLNLPNYMIPKRVLPMESLPTTPHGKLDRVALQAMLENPQ